MEREWAAYFGVRHAVAVNSASSGLLCALGAVGLGPGDEVIVSPWSMCVSATAPLFYGALPVFADVEPDCFCLDAADVERKITPKTRAIVVVDLFGQPYDAPGINALAEKYGLAVIEDAAQAPGAALNGAPAGTLGKIGVYSLNYHKHIHCGEGGIVVTNDDGLAERLSLIRNHAEAVVEGKGVENLVNMVGFNMRMTELDAAVARCQLRKLEKLNARRRENVAWLEGRLESIPCLSRPKVRPGGSHAYYVHACLYDEKVAGIPAERFVAAVKAELPPFALRESEGVKLGTGYVKPLYRLPLFHRRLAIGGEGWPFSLAPDITYPDGLCPVCERLYAGGIITHEFILPCMEEADLDDVVTAFHKVYELRSDL